MKINKILMVFAMLLIFAVPMITAEPGETPEAPDDYLITEYSAIGGNIVGDNIEFTIKVYNKGYDYVSLDMQDLVINFGDGTQEILKMGYIPKSTIKTFTINHVYETRDTFDTTATIDFEEYYMDNNIATLSVEATTNINITEISDEILALGENYTHQVVVITEPITLRKTFSISANQPTGMNISETGLIEWAPTAVGVYSDITVRVEDELGGVDTETFTIEVREDLANIDITVASVTFGNYNTERGTTDIETITITNNGMRTINDVNVVLSGVELNYAVNMTGTIPSTMNVGDSFTLTLTGIIPEELDGGYSVLVGSILASATNSENGVIVTDNANVYFQAESGLQIEEIEIYVNGDKEETFNSDGESYDEVKEGDDITVVVFVENNHNEDIEDVYFELNNDNSDWDFADDEESNERDIDEDDTEELSFEFTIDPDDLDENSDDSATFTVVVRGEDSEENYEHYDVWTFTLEIERENDEITITNVYMNPTVAYCSDRQVTIDVDFKNTGENEQDEFSIEVRNSALGFSEVYMDDDFESKDSDDKTFIFGIPSDIESGIYSIEISAYNEDDDLTDRQYVDLEIICGTNTNDEPYNPFLDGDGFDVNQPILNFHPIYGEDDFRGSPWYMALLIILIILTIAGIVMLSALAKRK